jgi:hypothetical protein
MMTSPLLHPSACVPAHLSAGLRAGAAEAERLGALLPGQLDIIYHQQWFNLFVPQSYGGLGLSLPEALRLEEALAWTDGAVGWTVTLCSGAAWFIGFLEAKAARAIFSHPNACLAGSGQASGVAEVLKGGYKVLGRWHWATGTPHATVFTANCVLHNNGAPLRDKEGQPLVRPFWFYRDEVQVHPNWQAIGMVATASHSFEVEGLTVSADRCFTIDPQGAVLSDPIYQYPFLPFAQTTLAVNSSGMATRFIDLCRPSRALESAKQLLEAERGSFFRIVDSSWKELLERQSLSAGTMASIGRASRQLAALSLRLVDELYPRCGLEGADTRTEINRVWRNLHTASQHSLLRADDE